MTVEPQNISPLSIQIFVDMIIPIYALIQIHSTAEKIKGVSKVKSSIKDSLETTARKKDEGILHSTSQHTTI